MWFLKTSMTFRGLNPVPTLLAWVNNNSEGETQRWTSPHTETHHENATGSSPKKKVSFENVIKIFIVGPIDLHRQRKNWCELHRALLPLDVNILNKNWLESDHYGCKSAGPHCSSRMTRAVSSRATTEERGLYFTLVPQIQQSSYFTGSKQTKRLQMDHKI